MKRSKKGRDDFSGMIRKIFFRISGVLAASFVLPYAIYLLAWKNRAGDWLVAFLEQAFRMDREEAFLLYHRLFRGNRELILGAVMLLIFLLLLRLLFRWMARYFREINQGIDALLAEGGEPIRLLPEMAPFEAKLNAVRETLNRRKAETQLAEKRKNELVMYLAHDIRTPLTSVTGYLGLLDESPEMPPEQKQKYVRIALEKARRLEKLVQEFFEITRFDLQRDKLRRERIDLYYMLVQLADEFYPILSAKGIGTRLCAGEDLTVRGDPDKLARLFGNLLKNAAAYSYPNTEIVLSAREREDRVEISFQNRGPEIPAGELEAVFDKFRRLNAARATDTGGAGLGLSIAREIAVLHGGTVTAESGPEATVFTVSLPRSESRSPALGIS